MSSVKNHDSQKNPDACITRSVAQSLAEEPSLEAVTIDPAGEKLSVATLGRVDVDQITRRVTDRIQSGGSPDWGKNCSLLQGKKDCGDCTSPLSADERRLITIQSNGAATTIARVTCPTAPKFWRWRDLPWPRVEPRQVEFLEEDHDDHH